MVYVVSLAVGFCLLLLAAWHTALDGTWILSTYRINNAATNKGP